MFRFGQPLVRGWRLIPYAGVLRRLRANWFDAEYYTANHPDVAVSGMKPLLHFLIFGAFEGRKPHPFFDTAYYNKKHPEVMAAEVNPLAHYLKYGAAKGWRPHPLLDAELLKSAGSPEEVLYNGWMRAEGRQVVPSPAATPRFSLLMEIARPRLEWLMEAIASVQGQSYGYWELCVWSGAGMERGVREYLEGVAKSDPRVRVNHDGASSSGEYLAEMGQEDRLAPDALHWLASKAPAEVVYGDEDELNEAGERVRPLFKPDWSPELLGCGNYPGRITAVSRAAWERWGGLRVAESVQHVPRVLYHARGRMRAGVEETGGVSGGTKRVSVIVCSRTPKLLERCLRSIEENTRYANREVIVVEHVDAGTIAMQVVIGRHGARRVEYAGVFDFSRMNNLGAQAAGGEVLLFLNDDTEAREPVWLDRLVAQLERADVGVAGARLLYPTGTLQHGGVAIGIGRGCGHIGRNMRSAPPHWPWLEMTRDVSAVTGACLAIRAALFREMGGFSAEFPVNYNDIDLCLRAREAGYRVIYEAGATLLHYECQTRAGVVTPEEQARWKKRWGKRMEEGDPFYSPNLTRDYEDLSLSEPG